MVGDLSRVFALVRAGTGLAPGRTPAPAGARPRACAVCLPAVPRPQRGRGALCTRRAAGRRLVFPVPPAGVFAVAPKTTYPLETARHEDHYLVAPGGGRN